MGAQTSFWLLSARTGQLPKLPPTRQRISAERDRYSRLKLISKNGFPYSLLNNMIFRPRVGRPLKLKLKLAPLLPSRMGQLKFASVGFAVGALATAAFWRLTQQPLTAAELGLEPGLDDVPTVARPYPAGPAGVAQP